MTLIPTFTNGRNPAGGLYTVSSRIPLIELNQIQQIRSSVETIIALLNKAESSYSWQQKNSLTWSECRTCRAIFLHYRKSTGHYCSQTCCGKAKTWIKAHAANGKNRKCPGKGCVGSKNPAWKGGLTYFKRKGKYASQKIKYVRCPASFKGMARSDGYVMEHRLLVATELGRPLTRAECVHHVNHDATDNRLENLMLFASNADHKRYEHGQAIEPLWPRSHHSSTQV